MSDKNRLIVYYTRSGTADIVAKALVETLGADCERLIDRTPYDGVIGYIRAGAYAMTKKLASIEKVKYNPKDYCEVIFITPVWAGVICPAVRTYIAKHLKDLKSLTLITTSMSGRAPRTAGELQKSYRLNLVCRIDLSEKDVRAGKFMDKLESVTQI